MSDLREHLKRTAQHLIGSSLDARKGSLAEQIADAILADLRIAVVELPDTYDNQLFDSITTSTAAEIDDHRGVVYLWDDLDPPDEGPSAYGPSVIRTAAAALLAAARKAESDA